jgi:hypothetical protein
VDLSSLFVSLVLMADAKVPAPIPTEESVKACVDSLTKAQAKILKQKSQWRIALSLKAIGSSCVALNKPMAQAATKAAWNKRKYRAKILAAAQSVCEIADALAAAESLTTCAPGANDAQGPILKDIDAGTFAFLKSFRAQLESAGPLPAPVDALLSNLALSVALEGESLAAKSH